MPFKIADMLLLLACAQGLFLAVLIFHRHRSLYANRFLGVMILGYSLVLLHLFLDEIRFSFDHPVIPFIAIGLVFLVGPLHYLYAKYLIQSRPRLLKADRAHFIPLAMYYVIGIVIFFSCKPSLIRIAQSDNETHVHSFYLTFNWFIILYSAVYLILTLRLLSRYRSHIRDVFSSLEKIRLDWLKNITLMMAAALSVFTFENALYLADLDLSDQFTLSSTLVAIYIYALGYMGLFKSEVFHDPLVEAPMRHLAELGPSGYTLNSDRLEKYEKSGLSIDKAADIKKDLIRLMEREQPYLSSELTLNQLADRLGISPHNLSEVINTRLNQNFFDFVNGYRLKKVMSDLADPEKNNLKVLAIAFEAGFNSKTSFNTIFKKATGQTPTEYRLSAGKSIADRC